LKNLEIENQPPSPPEGNFTLAVATCTGTCPLRGDCTLLRRIEGRRHGGDRIQNNQKRQNPDNLRFFQVFIRFLGFSGFWGFQDFRVFRILRFSRVLGFFIFLGVQKTSELSLFEGSICHFWRVQKSVLEGPEIVTFEPRFRHFWRVQNRRFWRVRNRHFWGRFFHFFDHFLDDFWLTF